MREMVENRSLRIGMHRLGREIQVVSHLRKTAAGTFAAAAVFAGALNPAAASAQVTTPAEPAPAAAAMINAALEPADDEGRPLKPCGPANDGEAVTTVDMHGSQSRWICFHVNPIFQDPYWEWNEVIHN